MIERNSEAVIGSSRFNGLNLERSSIEIGYTFLSRDYWGTGYNRELKKLMLDYAFQFVETAFFYVGENNYRSQKAMGKLGAKESPEKRISLQLDGRMSTSIVFRIEKKDWI